MESVISIIDRIIEEHKVILSEAKSLEVVTNDTFALEAIRQGREAFMPGRFDPKEGLLKLESLRAKLEQGLEKHFNMEETRLLEGIQRFAGDALLSTYETLLKEHREIRERMAELKGHVDELLTEYLSRHVWESKAYDMRAHMTNIYSRIAVHASNEEKLLHQVRKDLLAKQEEKK